MLTKFSNDNFSTRLSICKGLILLLFIGILVSCESTQQQTQQDTEQTDIVIAEQVREILDLANASQSPERDQYYLQAATLLAEIDETDWARNLLASIDPDLLFVEDFVNYTLLYSQIAIANDSYFLAQRILTNPRVEQQWNSYSEENAKLLRARRAELFALLGEANKSVYERIRLSEFNLDLDIVQANQDAIWENLMAMSVEELVQLQQTEPNSVLKGWYELAALSKSNDTDLDRQQAMIEQWSSQWPNHPAAFRLPSDLQLVKDLAENQPTRVALLLPFSHPDAGFRRAAQYIRDGFMGAYYQAIQRGSRAPQVRVFDTGSGDINAIYDAAVNDGAEFIIGPLQKDHIDILSLRLELPVPTLALNEGNPTPYGFPTNLYQYSLSPEGEAIQVANRAWLEGHRRAMVLVPDNSIGSRSADAFIHQWETLGGQIVNRSFYDAGRDYKNYAQVVKDSLLISESEQRRQLIRQVIGTNVDLEYTPRRRQDLDFIFLLASAEEAQGMKPQLKLYYADNIPVYATSRVFTGKADNRNRDLNGIRFNTLPWLFSNDPIKSEFVKNARDYNDELYAMGIDSYRLYPRLLQLKQREGARIYGQTGTLSLTPEQKIQRDQIWAQIVNGVAQALPTVVSEAHVE